MGRMPKFEAKFELKFPFSACHFFACIGAKHPSRSMYCQNFDLVGNKLKSCLRYCENIVYTEEKTATPKTQIRLKMAGIQSAENVRKTHEVLVSGGSANSIAQWNGVLEDHGNWLACETLETNDLCVYVCGNGWETNTHTRSDTRSDNKRVLEQEILALVSPLYNEILLWSRR